MSKREARVSYAILVIVARNIENKPSADWVVNRHGKPVVYDEEEDAQEHIVKLRKRWKGNKHIAYILTPIAQYYRVLVPNGKATDEKARQGTVGRNVTDFDHAGVRIRGRSCDDGGPIRRSALVKQLMDSLESA